MAYGMTNYGIPQLRQRNIMSGYGYEPEMGYDPGMDDYGDPMFDPGGYNVGEILSPYMNKPAPQAPPIASTPSSGRAGVGPDPGLSDSIKRTMDAIGQVYTPEYTDRDRLRALMDAAPERQAPGFGRALVAAGLSLKAADPIATSEAVMTAPHRRNMADWLAKSEPFLKTAELENRSNVNERTLAGNVVTAETQARRLEEQGRQADQKNEVARTKAEADMIRARAYQLKNNGWKIDFSGPRIIGIGPNNERMDLGETGKLSDRDKIDLQGEWGVKRAKEYGEAAANRAEIAGGQFFVDKDGNPVYGNPRTQPPTMPPAGSRPMTGSGNKEESPGDALKRQQMEWDELRATDPVVRKWTNISANGKITLKKAPEAGSMPWSYGEDDVNEYNEVVRKLYGKTGVGPSTERQEAPPTNKGIGPSPAVTAPKVAPPKVPEAPPRSYMENGVRKFRETPPSGSYMENGVRKFYGQSQRTSDISLPLAGSPQNPAKTEDEMMAYAALQQRAAEFVRSQGKPVTQEYIDFAIRKGWVR